MYRQKCTCMGARRMSNRGTPSAQCTRTGGHAATSLYWNVTFIQLWYIVLPHWLLRTQQGAFTDSLRIQFWKTCLYLLKLDLFGPSAQWASRHKSKCQGINFFSGTPLKLESFILKTWYYSAKTYRNERCNTV